MIKLVGNCKDMLPLSWNDYCKSNTGEIRPNKKLSQSADKNTDLAKQRDDWRKAGYIIENDTIKWEMFYQNDLKEKVDFSRHHIFSGKKINWWIAKVMPGKCFPMHRDSFDKSHNRLQRYWVALDDHKWGHVFMIGDIVLKEYKRGDIFQFEDELHGAMNVGLEPKLSLQILSVEE